MRVLLLALILLTAGCANPEPEPAPTSSASGTSPAHPEPPVAPPPAPAPVDVAEPHEATGKTGTAACLATPAAVRCQTLVEGSGFTVLFPANASVVAVDLELSWAEGNEVMGFGIVREENGTMVGVHEHYVEGPSPLAVSFDLAALAGQRLGYHVSSFVGTGAGGVGGSASPGQAWELAGTVTVRKAAA